MFIGMVTVAATPTSSVPVVGDNRECDTRVWPMLTFDDEMYMAFVDVDALDASGTPITSELFELV